MFERFTAPAVRVLFSARSEASQLGSLCLEPEHLLLGLMRDGKGAIGHLFAALSIQLADLLQDLKQRITPLKSYPPDMELPLSASTKRALQGAAEKADALCHDYIGAEHPLLGVPREGQSMAASILMERGMKLDRVRNDLADFLDRSSPE
jgi:ATP-dependent Clp protease ATP-binding subunit ClpC